MADDWIVWSQLKRPVSECLEAEVKGPEKGRKAAQYLVLPLGPASEPALAYDILIAPYSYDPMGPPTGPDKAAPQREKADLRPCSFFQQ